jgi:hypothetical protein
MQHVVWDKADKTNPITRKIYTYVFAAFNMSTPLHQLALIVAIFISKILPDLFYDPDDRPDLETLTSEDKITRAARALPWKPNDNRRGCKVPSHFVAMFTVFIIAIFDYDSPLHDYFADKSAFPVSWNKKHTPKGISSLNLIRLGLARGRSGRIWKGGILDTDWSLLHRHEVANFHAEVMALLDDRKYGPFNVAVKLFGRHKASQMHGTLTINPVVAVLKRPASDTKGSDGRGSGSTKRQRV